MSKKVDFPVMSPAITGILFTIGVLLVLLRTLVAALITDAGTIALLNGMLGFLAVFIVAWALTSLSLHPAVEPRTKILFAAVTLLILVAVFTDTFKITIRVY